MRKISASILGIFATIAACLKWPWHLLACYIASRLPEQDSNYCYDDGRYEVVSVDIDETSSLKTLLNTNKVRHEQCLEIIMVGNLTDIPREIQSRPWTVHIINDDLLRGMWRFRPKLAHLVTVCELWKGLELGVVSLETTVQGGKIRYFVVVNSGNDHKWKLHLLQQEWKKYQAVRQAKRLRRPEKRAAFAR